MKPKFSLPIALLAGGSLFLAAGSALAQSIHDWTPGTTVPDNNPVGIADSRNIDFDPAAVITGLEVRLHLTGGWNGDIFGSLVHDTGFTVLLNRPGNTASNPGGSASSGMNLTFIDSAATDIHTGISGSGFITGTWQPDARTADPLMVTDLSPRTAFLSSFNEAPVQGNWTLFLADNAASDTSMLAGWGLTIHSETRGFIWDSNGNNSGIGGAGTWSSSSGNWATTDSGTTTAAQNLNQQLVFRGTGGAVNVDGTVSPRSGLRFDSSGYALTGGTIQMQGGSAAVNTVAVDPGISASVGSIVSGSNGMTKTGAGSLTLGGANLIGGGFNLDEGTLIAANTSGSATGTGQLNVAAGATLGGNGIIAPAGSAGIHVAGVLAPGASIGTLSFDFSTTTGGVTMAPGAHFAYELGSPNSAIASIGPGTSDMIELIGAGADAFAFDSNIIDFSFTGANGYYKLFATNGGGSSVWSGLAFDSVSGVVSSGLSYQNLPSSLSGDFLVGTSGNGGAAGDIYFHVIPEYHSALLGGLGLLLLLRRRRSAQSCCFSPRQ